jgi:hypothetical protein
VAEPSVVGEIAERLAALQLGATAPRRLAIVVPLLPGSHEAVRRLLAQGRPFDPEEMPELDRHEVFLTPEEAIFVVESDRGADAIAPLLSKPDLWKAADAWQEHIAGPPRLAEVVYSWARAEEAGELSFLPTPGPGDRSVRTRSARVRKTRSFLPIADSLFSLNRAKMPDHRPPPTGMVRRRVDGSSPSDGSAKAPVNRGFLVQVDLAFVACAVGMEHVVEQSGFHGLSVHCRETQERSLSVCIAGNPNARPRAARGGGVGLVDPGAGALVRAHVRAGWFDQLRLKEKPRKPGLFYRGARI